jgi:hypothetical protein
MGKLACLLTAASAAALVPIAAQAQDISAEPNYETINLEAGFANDPYVVNVQSGGSTAASTLGDTCGGFIANSPDVRLNYKSGTLPLYISATSADDTTLVVHAPDGQWYCSDDDAGNLNPMVTFDAPRSGQYTIWVGTYADANMHDAQLNISEIARAETDYEGTTADIDPRAQPAYGTVSLAAGFTPDPYTTTLIAGGSNEASQLGEPCVGTVASAPDFRLNYEAGISPLYIRSVSEGDTTLAVNGPDGQWYCDDDGGDGLNAQVWFDAPTSGQYDIFVGTFSSTETLDATLEISELAAE